MNYKIFNSIDEIGRSKWDAAFGDIPEGYSFYKALENSQLFGFKFYYFVAYQAESILLIAPLFVTDFNLDIAVKGVASKVIKLIRKIFPRFLIFKTVFCGSPFAEYGVLGIKADAQAESKLLIILKNGLDEFAHKTGSALIIFKDFLKENSGFLDPLKKFNYFVLESFPAVSVELNFSSFEDYLKSLSKSMRKNLSKKLNQAYQKGKIEVKITQDASEQIERIYELYENTYTVGSTKFEHLSKEFFLQVIKDLHPHTCFFLYYINGRLSAFNLCFVYNNLLIDKFIGFDYDISSEYNLYFVSWAYNIKWCIENRLHFYYPGQTDYGLKIRLGGKFMPLYLYAKHRNALFNLLLGPFIPFLKPDSYEKPAKK